MENWKLYFLIVRQVFIYQFWIIMDLFHYLSRFLLFNSMLHLLLSEGGKIKVNLLLFIFFYRHIIFNYSIFMFLRFFNLISFIHLCLINLFKHPATLWFYFQLIMFLKYHYHCSFFILIISVSLCSKVSEHYLLDLESLDLINLFLQRL